MHQCDQCEHTVCRCGGRCHRNLCHSLTALSPTLKTVSVRSIQISDWDCAAAFNMTAKCCSNYSHLCNTHACHPAGSTRLVPVGRRQVEPIKFHKSDLLDDIQVHSMW